MQLLSFCHVGVKCERIILKIGPKINLPSEPLSPAFGNIRKVVYIWGMAVVGRPKVYETPELMAQAIDLYLATCEAEKKAPTVTRMALALGFESRQSFYDYEEKPEFSYIIKTARLYVEAGYEDGLRENNCTGSIFALKNMGWKDKVETGFTDNDGKDVSPVQIYLPGK